MWNGIWPICQGGYGSRSQRFLHDPGALFPASSPAKLVFESAMLRPPKHLAAQIQALRAPMRRLNQEFIEGLIDKMPLRPDLKPEMVTRYLETIESLFQNMIVSYQGGHPAQDFHAMLETAGELLNMVLFGILRHADPA